MPHAEKRGAFAFFVGFLSFFVATKKYRWSETNGKFFLSSAIASNY